MNIVKHKWFAPVVSLVGLFFVLALFAGTFDDKIEPGLGTQTGEASYQNPYTVVAEAHSEQEMVPGSIRAKENTRVSSRLLARVERVMVRADDVVEAGDVLVTLDDKDLKARVTQIENTRKSVQVRIDQAKPQLDRVQALFNDGVTSQANLDKAKADYEGLVAQMAAVEAQESEAKTVLAYATIKAPISGRIIDRLIEPGDTASPGQAVVSIYNPGTLRVEAFVRETLAMSLSMGQTVRVKVDSLDQGFDAKIEEIVPQAHTGSRTFLVKASLPVDERLVPGMFARLALSAEAEQVIYVPMDYVTTVGQLTIVHVLEDGQKNRRVIRLANVNKDGQAKLLSGLSVGDVLVK